jgi:hypothetical protein
MVITVRAISRASSEDISRRFKENAAKLRQRALELIAKDIVDFSPVDTGTYVMAHVAGATSEPGGGVRSSHGKIRGRDKGQFRNLALGNLQRSVSSDAIMNAANVYFHNRAEHAEQVEFMGWKSAQAYHVYGQARRAAPTRIADAARELGFELR